MRARWAGLAVVLSMAVGVCDDAPSVKLYRVQHRVDGVSTTTECRVLVRARDGGLLLETRDGRLTTVKPADLVGSVETEAAFQPCDVEELKAQLQAELGPDFHVVSTKRYVIATNASEAYGLWCGRLFERLQVAFLGYWKRAGLELEPPPQPLVAVILATPEQYAAFAARDAGGAIAGSQGYYSVRTNRIVLSDLTHGIARGGRLTDAEMSQRLEAQLTNVATIVHEATHQIAFNCGLHVRYADNPMWLTEGMAMFCEAPDLRGTSGWRTIGKVHPGRLAQFRDFAANRREPNSLASLITSEDRFRDPATAADAYAESWALTYFLIRERRAQYVEYLQRLSAKPRLVWDTPERREAAFLEVFATDWATLERDFSRFMQRVSAG